MHFSGRFHNNHYGTHNRKVVASLDAIKKEEKERSLLSCVDKELVCASAKVGGRETKSFSSQYLSSLMLFFESIFTLARLAKEASCSTIFNTHTHTFTGLTP